MQSVNRIRYVPAVTFFACFGNSEPDARMPDARANRTTNHGWVFFKMIRYPSFDGIGDRRGRNCPICAIPAVYKQAIGALPL